MTSAARDSSSYRAALVAAAAEGDAETLRALLATAPPSDVTPALARTFANLALSRAVANGHPDACVALLDAPGGASHSAPNASGNTPLHVAAARGHGRVLAVLLARGACVSARNAEGKTPIALAKDASTKAAISREVTRRKCASASANANASSERGGVCGGEGGGRTPGRRRIGSGSASSPARVAPSPRGVARMMRTPLRCVLYTGPHTTASAW